MQYTSVKGDIAQGKIRVPKKGRRAHINVKLLHYQLIKLFESMHFYVKSDIVTVAIS